jgi:glucosamine--fructose-6-phosphate aminotransferase (isomerizing)
VRGAYAIAVLSADAPDEIVVAKADSPLVIGIGDGEMLCASDIPALLAHTRDVVFLHDGEVATLTRGGAEVMTLDGVRIERAPKRIDWSPTQAEKGGYKHFMLKEIWEQPRAIRDTTLGRVSLDSGKIYLGEMDISDEELAAASSINIAACGTSWHAALAGKYMIERLARLPVDVDYASEYRYRNPIPDRNALGLLITQSGETADTLAAQREMKSLGSKTVAICNVVDAMVAREAHGAIYTHAGPEIGVASTKAFTAQLTALYLLALKLGLLRGRLDTERSVQLIEELSRVPTKIEEVLRSRSAQCEQLAASFANARDFLYLGRGIHFPIALEGALKLKEISYIHAEGYPAGEMKHGPNALIDETLPVVVLVTRDESDPASKLRYEKTLSNIQEVTARSGRVIAVATEGDTVIGDLVEHVIYIPPVIDMLSPIVEIVPLQLLAYYIAVRRGCDVDQPRNLAKSVTVE